MKKKYIDEILNLATNTEKNKTMSGDKLRDEINEIFKKDWLDHLDKLEEKAKAEETMVKTDKK